MSLTQTSGSTDFERLQEARRILFDMGLKDHLFDMNPKSCEFVEATLERIEKFGDRTIISPKQLFWLRDLKDQMFA